MYMRPLFAVLALMPKRSALTPLLLTSAHVTPSKRTTVPSVPTATTLVVVVPLTPYSVSAVGTVARVHVVPL